MIYEAVYQNDTNDSDTPKLVEISKLYNINLNYVFKLIDNDS